LSSSSDDGGLRRGPGPDLLEIGRIEKAHGLRGEVVVSLVTNMVEARTEPGSVFEAGDRSLTVTSSRPHGRRWLMSFDGVSSREAADALRGRALRAVPLSSDATDAGPLPPTAVHGVEVVAFVHELFGRRLIDQEGTDHGEIVAVVENPASDLLELGDGRLVPLAFYRALDPDAGTVSVEVPSGLLDGAAETVPTDRQ
jgi:16S rRNA processing protein RimM